MTRLNKVTFVAFLILMVSLHVQNVRRERAMLELIREDHRVRMARIDSLREWTLRNCRP